MKQMVLQYNYTGKPRVVTKIGRNEFCPCGSGKKYKKCHGRLNDWELYKLNNSETK